MVEQLSFEDKNRDYYDRYGEYYEEYQGYFRNSALLRRWEKNLEQCKRTLPATGDLKAIDFGCGTGLLCLSLLKMGFSVTAIDISEVMLQELQKKVAALPGHMVDRVRYVNGGMESLRDLEANSFHLVCESSVLHHVSNYTSFLELSHELLVPDGVLYLGREPLCTDERQARKVNFPLHVLVQIVDRLFTKAAPKGSFQGVFEEDIFSDYEKGGISCSALLAMGRRLGMEQLYRKVYNWHTSKEAYFLDNILLPRFLRYERNWRTFVDLAFQKNDNLRSASG